MNVEDFTDLRLYEHARSLGYPAGFAYILKDLHDFEDDSHVFREAYLLARAFEYSKQTSSDMANRFLEFFRSF